VIISTINSVIGR